MDMKMTSPVFEEGAAIPGKYTCDGVNVSPPLSWTSVPEGAESLALIFDDPDAPFRTWVHWVIFNLPVDSGGLPENVPPDEKLKNGAKQGTNDFRRIGYGGPCPPGGTHRYFFKLYALDKILDLDAGANKKQLIKAIKGHILAESQLVGRYTRH